MGRVRQCNHVRARETPLANPNHLPSPSLSRPLTRTGSPPPLPPSPFAPVTGGQTCGLRSLGDVTTTHVTRGRGKKKKVSGKRGTDGVGRESRKRRESRERVGKKRRTGCNLRRGDSTLFCLLAVFGSAAGERREHAGSAGLLTGRGLPFTHANTRLRRASLDDVQALVLTFWIDYLF